MRFSGHLSLLLSTIIISILANAREKGAHFFIGMCCRWSKCPALISVIATLGELSSLNISLKKLSKNLV
jgi:hypothetical protein